MINDNQEIHTMQYDDLFHFLVKLVPSKSAVFRDMIDRFRSFFVSVEDTSVKELVFDFATERKKLSDNLKTYNMSRILKEIKQELEKPSPEKRYVEKINKFAKYNMFAKKD